MMTYKEFQIYVLEHVKEYLTEKNHDISFRLSPGKERGVEAVNLETTFPNSTYIANLHLDSAYDTYKQNGDLEFTMDDIAETIQEARKKLYLLESTDFNNYENVKNRLTLQLINRERNESILKKVTHRDLPDTDLSVIYFVEISRNESGMQCFKVNSSMLNVWKIEEAQLYQDALKNMEKQRPFLLNDIMGTMMGLPGKPNYLPEQMYGNEFYSLSTQIANGAAAILYPDLLKKIGERLQGNFFLVPSSIHEIYLIRDEGENDLETLQQVVKDMKEYPIPKRTFLSDRIYTYDRESDRFYLVAERDEKREEQSVAISQQPTDEEELER